MNQQEIDALSEALRKQGLTWNQTNFAIALVRNMQDKEREACAKACEAEHVGASVADACKDYADECYNRALRHAAAAIRERDNH